MSSCEPKRASRTSEVIKRSLLGIFAPTNRNNPMKLINAGCTKFTVEFPIFIVLIYVLRTNNNKYVGYDKQK